MTTTTKTTRKSTDDLLGTADDPQPGLRAYLEVKRAALLARREAAKANPLTQPNRIRARTTAESRSGVRRIRIRHHQIISDSGVDFAGYDLGPASPEIRLGVLSSCAWTLSSVIASKLALTASASKGSPSLKVTSSRGGR